MKLKLNERLLDVPPGSTIADLRVRYCPDADIFVLNGFPVPVDTHLKQGDVVVLCVRGRVPPDEELDILLSARHSPGVAGKLKQAFVGIAGLGGLGSNAAVSLVRVGVGKLLLVDFDVVEATNINRQYYFLDQIGLFKTDALADTLRRVRPSVELQLLCERIDKNNAAELFGRCDVAIEAFDSAACKVEFIETLQASCPELPVVAASGMAGYESANNIRTSAFGNLFVCGDQASAARQGRGLMAPLVGVAANHQANQVLRLLLGLDRNTAG